MERGVIANDLEGVSLNRIEDVLKGYLCWRTKEFVSTFRPSHALNYVTFSQPLKDLVGVGKVDALTFGYFGGADGGLSVVFREVKSAQDAALAPFRNSHIVVPRGESEGILAHIPQNVNRRKRPHLKALYPIGGDTIGRQQMFRGRVRERFYAR